MYLSSFNIALAIKRTEDNETFCGQIFNFFLLAQSIILMEKSFTFFEESHLLFYLSRFIFEQVKL